MFSPDLNLLVEKAFDQRDRENGSGVNVLVLIEMDEFNRVSTSMGLETTEILGAAFHERVRGFLRVNDHDQRLQPSYRILTDDNAYLSTVEFND